MVETVVELYLDPQPLRDWLEELVREEKRRVRRRGLDPETVWSAVGRRFGVDRKTIRRWLADLETELTLTRADIVVCRYGDPSVLYALYPRLPEPTCGAEQLELVPAA